MGSFDVSDGISGITIKDGDSCGLLLLLPNLDWPHSSNREEGTLSISPCSNFVHDPLGMYRPYCLPIWGKYNDYGTIENIKRDFTVKSLEKYFDIEIEKILSIVSQSSRSIFEDSSNILSVYGNGLKIKDHGGFSENWLEQAGFRKLNDEDNNLLNLINKLNLKKHFKENINSNNIFILPGVKEGRSYNKETGKTKGLNIPSCWFELSDRKNDKFMMRTFYLNEDKWEYKENWEQIAFCELVMEKTKSGFFNSIGGIQLGIKEEYRERVLELKKLSGMFIDKSLYEKLSINSIEDRREALLENTYPNKFMLPLLGFEFVKFVNAKNLKEEVSDDGLPITHKTNRNLIYKHKNAPEYYFGINDIDNCMCIDLYDLNMKDLDRGKGMFGNKYSMHPFSPKGIKTMMEKITGIPFEIENLLELPENYIRNKKTQDTIKRIKNQEKLIEKLTLQLNGDEEEDHRINLIFMKMEMNDYSNKEIHVMRPSIGIYSFFPRWKELYIESIYKNNKTFQNVTNSFSNYINILYGANKILMPSSHHWQTGEYKKQVEFNSIVTEIATNKNKKYMEEYGEE